MSIPRCFPHPTGILSRSSGDFSPPTTFHWGPNGPRCKGKPRIYPTYGGHAPPIWVARPPPSAHWAPISRGSPLILLLSIRDLLRRTTTVKRPHSIRIRASKRQHQSMLTGHWLSLRSASLPVYHRKLALPPPLPRSLPSLGWIRDHAYRLRYDPPKGAPFPFPHTPPGFPPPSCLDPLPPDTDYRMSTSPNASPDGPTLPRT